MYLINMVKVNPVHLTKNELQQHIYLVIIKKMQDKINIRNAQKADFNAIYQFVNELEETIYEIEHQKKFSNRI